MNRVGTYAFIAVGASLALCATASAQWVKLVNQTGSRLVGNPAQLVNDNLEKDFGIGDFNNDGQVDLAMMRKFWGSQTGGYANTLFMNEGGVLVDRTAEYASSSDIEGYNGFFDLTNDRDVKVIDVNNDGWVDLITTTTMSDGVIDVLGQPRCYINLGNDEGGNWLGFQHQRDRIPHIFPPNSTNAVPNPRFCDAAVGDFNSDGYADVFFVDYDDAETLNQTICSDLNGDGDQTDPGECRQSPPEASGHDFNNKLLLNHGASNPGFFYDSTNTVLTTTQLASAFGNTCLGADMNGDGKDDIVRINTLTGGQNISVFRRNATGTAFTTSTPYLNAPYFVEAGDLNGDGKLDLVVADDGKDRYMINTGNNAAGQPNFTTYTIAAAPSQFDHTIRLADMDKDGRLDAFITDVDADVGNFCPTGRFSHIYRNIYNGSNVSALFDMAGGDAAIPQAERSSWFDCAPMDIDGDGWLDLVVGRCAGVIVYMNRNSGIDFTYPTGKPAFVASGATTTFDVSLSILGGGTVVGGSAMLNYRVVNADGEWAQAPLTPVSGNTYSVELPTAACGEEIEWFVEATLTTGGPYREPASAPFLANVTPVGSAAVTVLDGNFEDGTTQGWTVVNQNLVGAGAKGWEVATPIGTTSNSKQVAPGTAANGTRAFVTWNGSAGGAAATTDLDGGPTTATSPAFDLSAVQSPTLSYSRWLFCNDALNPAKADTLVVEISNNGGASWVLVENVDWQANAWTRKTVSVSDFVTPTANMLLRFVVSDAPENSITEAGFDYVQVTGVTCVDKVPCAGDTNDDGLVNGSDVAIILGAWNTANPVADLNGDGTVNGSDLAIVLGGWGACP